MTGTLAIFREAFQSLIDQIHVTFVDVKPKKAQAPSGAAADAVEEGERVADEVVRVLVGLLTQVILNKSDLFDQSGGQRATKYVQKTNSNDNCT